MRVGLIACSKKKLDHAAPAQDLYQSPLFKLSSGSADALVNTVGVESGRFCLRSTA